MTDAEKAEFASTVFVAILTEKQDRLTHGLVLRQAMHDSISRGETPTGYRSDWLQDEAIRLVAYLEDAARAFDMTHPDDRCSVSDLLDLLETAAGLFQRED